MCKLARSGQAGTPAPGPLGTGPPGPGPGHRAPGPGTGPKPSNSRRRCSNQIFTHLSLKVDRGRPPNPIYFKGRSTFKEAAKTNFWHSNGPIWVPRPPDKCTGGDTGPRKRFPLVPRPCGAKKGPKLPKFKNLTRSTLRCNLLFTVST